MRLLVTGSRDWPSRDLVHGVLWQLMPKGHPVEQRLGMVVVQGGAKGADEMALDFALTYGTTFDTFKADWDKYGKGAGPIRNQAMVDSGADYFVAFRYRNSRGTTDCIERAKHAGIPGRVYDLAVMEFE